jgi:hypothetical protein
MSNRLQRTFRQNLVADKKSCRYLYDVAGSVAQAFRPRYHSHRTPNRYDQYHPCLADGMRSCHLVAAA